jgi:hypothetical protein
MSNLLTFINRNMDRHPNGGIKLIDFVRQFRASLPAADQPSFTRTRILSELSAAGFSFYDVGHATYIRGILSKAGTLSAAT